MIENSVVKSTGSIESTAFTPRELLAIIVYSLERDQFVDRPISQVVKHYLESAEKWMSAYENLKREDFADNIIIDAATMITRYGDSYGKFDEMIMKEFNKIFWL